MNIDQITGRAWGFFETIQALPLTQSLTGFFHSPHPLFLLSLFFCACLLMIWRLESMEGDGLEGTILGSLITPYFSGLSNLIFAFVLARTGGRGGLVIENCLVNNVTNLTVILGLPALFWGLNLFPNKKGNGTKEEKLHYLSLLFLLLSLLFVHAVLWALGRDGRLDFNDGLVLVGLFIFWQAVHIFEVLKSRIKGKTQLRWLFLLDLFLVLLASAGVFYSVDELVRWVNREGKGFFSPQNLGWLSGWLMVLPNALFAFYYAKRKRADIVYSSQIGDALICVPLCIGLFALYRELVLPDYFQLGLLMIGGSALIHFVMISLLGRLPKILGGGLTLSYGYFLYKGFRPFL